SDSVSVSARIRRASSAWPWLTHMSRGPAARNSGASKPPERLSTLGMSDSSSSACNISASAWLRAKPTLISLPPPPPPPPPPPSPPPWPPPPWEPREWAPRCLVASLIGRLFLSDLEVGGGDLQVGQVKSLHVGFFRVGQRDDQVDRSGPVLRLVH